MRSDEEKIDSIGNLIHKDISVKCSSTNSDLLNAITQPVLAVKPQNSGEPKADSETSTPDLNGIVTLITTTEKDLDETVKLIADSDLHNVILAVFVQHMQIKPRYATQLERLKLRQDQIVVIKRYKNDTPSLSTSRSNDETCVPPEKTHAIPVPRLALEEKQISATSESFSDWRESNESIKSPPCSPMRMSTRHKSSSPCPQSSSDISSPSHAHESKHSRKKQRLDLQTSATYEQIPSTQETMSETEKRKGDRHSPCRNQQNPIEFENTCINIIDWDTDTLKTTVSFHLEIYIADVIKQIIDYLKSIRTRRDSTAKVASVTTLDKLIYEIEGLLSQSITEAGKQMKQEIEQARLDTNVAKALLRVDGVYGCGTVYNRLNVHIEVGADNKMEAIKERIRQITERNDIKNTDYDVNVVQSKPTLYERLVVCC